MTTYDSFAPSLTDQIVEVIRKARATNIREHLSESPYFFWLGLDGLSNEERFGHLVVSTYTRTCDVFYHSANEYHPSWGDDVMDLVIYGHGCLWNFDSYTYVSFWLGESAVRNRPAV